MLAINQALLCIYVTSTRLHRHVWEKGDGQLHFREFVLHLQQLH